MIKFLVQRPVAVLMVFFGLLLLGVVAFVRTPVTPLPDINIPEITVHIFNTHKSADEIEKNIVQNIRVRLQQVTGIEAIRSETRDGYSVIFLRFQYGTDINYSFIEINEKIDLAMNEFPKNFERPRVIKSNVSDIPVFYLHVGLKEGISEQERNIGFLQLSDFVSQVAKRRLEQLPEVAVADVTGITNFEICISPKKKIVDEINFKSIDFETVLKQNNISSDNISVMDGNLSYDVRFSMSNPINVQDIGNIVFKHNNRIFTLKDIADISVQQQKQKGIFLSSNHNAISLAIIKQSNANMDDLRTSVNKVVTQFKKDYPKLSFEQSNDQTYLLEYSIRNLRQDLMVSGFLAFCLMFFFLKNIRSPMLIGISIPVSLILCVLIFRLMGITINMISLSGLVLGVGLMIDNSIIVIDSINEYRERGFTSIEACSLGTLEIIRPLLASVFTTCSVFLPLIFFGGISGALFFDQAMAITIGLCVSFLVCITLLPVLYDLFHRNLKISTENHSGGLAFDYIVKIYKLGFKWVFNNKGLTLGTGIFLLVINIFLFINIKKERLPSLKETEILVNIDWNQNITLGESRERTISLTKHLKGILQSSAVIGEHQYLLNKERQLSNSEVELYLKIKDFKQYDLTRSAVQGFLRRYYPLASFTVKSPKNVFEQIFGVEEPTLVLNIYGSESYSLPSRQLIDSIRFIMDKSFPKDAIPPIAMRKILSLSIIPERLLQYNLTTDYVYTSIVNKLNTYTVGDLRSGTKQIPINLPQQINNLDDLLNNYSIDTQTGGSIPLKMLVDIKEEQIYKTIEGDEKGNFISLNIQSSRPEIVVKKVENYLKKRQDVRFTFKGSYFSNTEMINKMLITLVISIFLLYFILAAQFGSLIQPFIVLLELPVGMCGALVMLYIFDSSINLMSLIGLIVMAGIIINDSILKIDAINNLRKNEGFSLIDAITTAGKRRLKSIIMTSLVTILSMAPFLFGDDIGAKLQLPLSLALIGGMVVGTPVSLYLIPLIYWFYYRKTELDNI